MVCKQYSVTIGYLTPPFAYGDERNAALVAKGIAPSRGWSFWIGEFCFLSTGMSCAVAQPFYLALRSARAALLREYSGPGAAVSLSFRMGGEIGATLGPAAFYFSMQMLAGYMVDGVAANQYAENTPWCHTFPEAPGWHGVQYYGCDLLEDIYSGRALENAFLTNTTWSPYVWADPSLVNSSKWDAAWPVAQLGTLPLSAQDVARNVAVEMYEKEGEAVAYAAMYQAWALIYGMLSSQVISRIARVSFVDAVRFSVSPFEVLALSTTSILIILGLTTLGSSATFFAFFRVWGLWISNYTILILLFSLWRVSANAKTSTEIDEERAKEQDEEQDAEEEEEEVFVQEMPRRTKRKPGKKETRHAIRPRRDSIGQSQGSDETKQASRKHKAGALIRPRRESTAQALREG